MSTMTTLQFVNHASLLVKHGAVSLLSDPWYQGDAFHKGWNLIHEFRDDEISNLLNNVTHIWISHEHPDHFSIGFFKKFGEQLREKNIQILFQETNDKRVESFLAKSGFNLKIMTLNAWLNLVDDFEILCFKDSFYDSGLSIRTSDKTILNLNDCEVRTRERCEEILNITGECDILASQFSYAAWKGGIDNIAWRRLAAKEKIDTIKLQASYFKPKVIVPFASYVYFSNKSNFYLNDVANTPEDIVKAFSNDDVHIKIMAPFEVLDDLEDPPKNEDAVAFWQKSADSIDSADLNYYDVISFDTLKNSFGKYKERIFQNNTKWFMRLVRYISPISAFKPIIIEISDLGIVVELDLFADTFDTCHSDVDLSMSSESLDFIFTNTFGFDTLTVNGCFEEKSASGFSRATRTLAVENLNNMGIKFRPSIIFNFQVIVMFMSRLWRISKKIHLARP